jgi:hypothetical protein
VVDSCHSADGGIWTGEAPYDGVEYSGEAHCKVEEDVEEGCGEEEGKWKVNGCRVDRMTRWIY